MHTQEFIAQQQAVLTQRRAELLAKIAGRPEHLELGADWDSSIQEVEADEVSEDLRATWARELELVEAALERIAAGTYGVDADGNMISENRLRVLPWATEDVAPNETTTAA
jgi:RNA polymerase-binding transcription factor DksA